nr:MAG TPA: ENOD40 protein [Caudoviricetes sp.]
MKNCWQTFAYPKQARLLLEKVVFFVLFKTL